MNIGSVMPSEIIGVVATVDPQTVANSAVYSDVVDMAKWHTAMFIFLTRTPTDGETLDWEIQYCDSNGANPATLKAGTQRAAHATNNDNIQCVIECRASDLLQISEAKQYVRAKIVTGGATGGVFTVVGLGVFPRTGVATDLDLASVCEVARAT